MVSRKEVSKVIEDWVNLFNLQSYEIEFTMTEIKNLAEIQTDYKYKRAVIYISPKIKRRELNRAISHELLHILVGEIRAQLRPLLDRITQAEADKVLFTEESVVEQLSRVFCSLVEFDPKEVK